MLVLALFALFTHGWNQNLEGAMHLSTRIAVDFGQLYLELMFERSHIKALSGVLDEPVPAFNLMQDWIVPEESSLAAEVRI